tara:strand:+ start:6094 stop:6963 length:870 start_codon:yes stop_codon:yes gene_type:complete
VEIYLKNKENNIFRLEKDKKNFIDFCPNRGGLICNWTCNGENILYFDQIRFLNKKLSIRGGVPILFPICGNIDPDFSLFGRKYSHLPQHGFARDLNWEFKLNQENQSLNLFLKDTKYSRQFFPFSFELKIDVFLKLNGLIFEIEIINNSNNQMPMSFGLHPYFNISDFKNIEFIDNPIICLDQKHNNLQLSSNYLSRLDKGIDLLMYSSGSLSFKDYGFGRKITLNNSYPFDISVIWTDPPRQMICMEPWTSPRNSLVDGCRKILISSDISTKLNASILISQIQENLIQ